jgi:peptide/nickel transport system ATP-binding protein
MKTPLFELDDFSVEIPTSRGIARPVNGLSLTLEPGRSIGIVGESGSGKSVAMMAACGLLPQARTSGSVRFEGRDLLALPASERRALLGRHIGMVFQEPMTALNPVMRIDRQIAEPLVTHGLATAAEALRRSVESLHRVGIAQPERVARQFPHELSGGMRQRVGIAMAIACGPRLLIADEPTTALDATVQAQILRLLTDLRRDLGMSLVLISHDLGVIGQVTDEVCVLYAGSEVERCPTASVFSDPQHPYTISLLGSLPQTGREGERLFAIDGSVPSALQRLPGCRFAPRCRLARAQCEQSAPVLHEAEAQHLVACHLAPIEATGQAGAAA